MKIRFLLSLVLCALCFSNSINVLAQEKLTCIGADVYGNNRRLSRTEVEMSLKNQPQCLSMYQSGKGKRGTGTGLLITGVVVAPVGLIVMVVGMADMVDTYDYNSGGYTTGSSATYNAGLLLFTLGNAAIAGGIIYKVVGKNKIRKSIDIYNSAGGVNIDTSDLPDSYNFSVGLRPNGLGLTLKF